MLAGVLLKHFYPQMKTKNKYCTNFKEEDHQMKLFCGRGFNPASGKRDSETIFNVSLTLLSLLDE
jgi:hypothetical protein